MESLVLIGAGFLAGIVDAIVGGGGLIQIPVLFTLFPESAAGAIFGTNKLAAICGTTVAAYRYRQALQFRWARLGPAFLAALIFSFCGAMAVSKIPRNIIRPLVLGLLVLVTVYTLLKKDFGSAHAPRLCESVEVWSGAGVGAALGFYDGFFGPGTGAFLIFVYIRLFGYDFLSASASAKVLNWATNLAALVYFGTQGVIMWKPALIMGASNAVGSWLGTTLAIRKGTAFIRSFFLVVLVMILVKFAHDTFS